MQESPSPINAVQDYRGRFAPTPTGPLHFGSLVTALASYLDARKHHGTWLVRIEDIDPLREAPGAADRILAQLEAHGLHWDESVRYQSNQTDRYQQVLDQLIAQGKAYPCTCSRKQLRQNQGHHLPDCPGVTAETGPEAHPIAIKFRCTDTKYAWMDRLCGPVSLALRAELDDFVLRRKEGYFAYQLAVVCDDIEQRISHVVRGRDLLDNTPMQLALYDTLGVRPPAFAHTPLIVSGQGQKLSKQNHARPIESEQANANLRLALSYLNHPAPPGLNNAPSAAILEWAIDHWQPERLKGISSVTHPGEQSR